uniref:Spartin n=1 Tax=Callorhinchus milii TaxID=7868 RepID=A0A4W3JRT6_CALMI
MEQHNPTTGNAAEWLSRIKDEYKEAFIFINKGLSADEAGQKQAAKQYYRQGQKHLVKGVHIPSNSAECTGPQWDKARQMQTKMRETLNNIQTRLVILEGGEIPAASHQQGSFSETARSDNTSAKPKRLYPVIPVSSKEKSSTMATTGNSSTPAATNLLSPEAPSVSNEQPPMYTPQAVGGHLTISYGTESGEFVVVGDEMFAQRTQPPPVESLGTNANEVLLIQQGVQIFYVTPDGNVSAPSYPGYLRIVNFSDASNCGSQNQPRAFLQVCDWQFPLMSSQSIVLKCNSGVYMFPDVMSQVPGSYVGVVLSSELPAADRELFEVLLRQMAVLKVQDPEASPDVINLSQIVPVDSEGEPSDRERAVPEWSEKVSNGILSGASWLSWGLVKGAEFTGKAIHKGASKLREHIQPDDKPSTVSPTMAKGLNVARQATGTAVKASQFLVDGVCTVAGSVGKHLAPHVKKHGSKLIPESIKNDSNSQANLDGALVVAASGVQGFATVWNGLERAAKCIVTNVASETVHTVQHKDVLDQSALELRKTVSQLEKRLDHVEDEGSEWKTRYETQQELNRQLKKQIVLLQEKVEHIRGNPADRLSSVRSYEEMPEGALKQLIKQLEKEKKSLQNQLKDYEWKIEHEAKVCLFFLKLS